MAKIAERHRLMMAAYNRVCILYNENPDKTEPFDFFSVFDRFVRNYKVHVQLLQSAMNPSCFVSL